MTTTRPQVAPDGYYQLKEAAAALQVDKSTLLRYTQRGLCKASFRKVNGFRIWKGSELLKVWYTIY